MKAGVWLGEMNGPRCSFPSCLSTVSPRSLPLYISNVACLAIHLLQSIALYANGDIAVLTSTIMCHTRSLSPSQLDAL